jgi:uncharacterized protein YjiS (DUF1127 family)
MTQQIAQSLWPPQPTLRLPDIARLARWFALWRRRAAEREQIARFSERELRDAGLTAGDVYRELATPFWKTSD